MTAATEGLSPGVAGWSCQRDVLRSSVVWPGGAPRGRRDGGLRWPRPSCTASFAVSADDARAHAHAHARERGSDAPGTLLKATLGLGIVAPCEPSRPHVSRCAAIRRARRRSRGGDASRCCGPSGGCRCPAATLFGHATSGVELWSASSASVSWGAEPKAAPAVSAARRAKVEA